MAAEDRRELDGEDADAARAPLDQHLLAGFQGRVVHQCLPGGQRRERQRRGLYVGDRIRLGGKAGGGHDHVFGGRAVPVEVDRADHLIAHGQVGDAAAETGHRARHLMRRYDRCPVRAVTGGPRQVPGQLREGNRCSVYGNGRLAQPGGLAAGACS